MEWETPAAKADENSEPVGAQPGARLILSGPWLVSLVAWPATLLGWYYITLAADPSWLRDRFLLAYLLALLAVDSALCVWVLSRATRQVRSLLRSPAPLDLAATRAAWHEALHLPLRTAWLIVWLIVLTVLPITLYLLMLGETMLMLHGWTAAFLVGACELTLLFPLVQASTLPFLRHLKSRYPELRVREPGAPTPPLRAYFALALMATATVATLLVARLIHLRENPGPTPLESLPEGAAIALAAVCLLSMVGGIGLQLYLSILMPLRTLARAMTRFAEGDASARVGLLHVGEIGLLSEHFDDMVVALARSQAVLAEREALLRHVQRFEAMGTVAATFAHEVANPLAGIRMNLKVAADMVREEVSRPPDSGTLTGVGTLLEGALDAAEQMALLLHDLRAFGRHDTDEREACELAAVLDMALRIAGTGLRRTGQVERDYRPAPAVLGNAHKLTQVFLNLLLNAVQAIPEGRRGVFRVGVRAVEGGVEAWITDNGCGIPSHLSARLFDALFTTKPQGQGTGLGLHVSQRIVEAHGGRIWHDPQADEGATFRVFLPAANATG